MTFEDDLEEVFDTAIDVKDTVWYSEYETLYDRIIDVFEQYRYDMWWEELYVQE